MEFLLLFLTVLKNFILHNTSLYTYFPINLLQMFKWIVIDIYISVTISKTNLKCVSSLVLLLQEKENAVHTYIDTPWKSLNNNFSSYFIRLWEYLINAHSQPSSSNSNSHFTKDKLNQNPLDWKMWEKMCIFSLSKIHLSLSFSE